MIIMTPGGEKVLILLTKDRESQELLYQNLCVDAYQFKKEVAENIEGLAYISTGYKGDKNEIIWNDDYIAVPKWYENN